MNAHSPWLLSGRQHVAPCGDVIGCPVFTPSCHHWTWFSFCFVHLETLNERTKLFLHFGKSGKG